MEPIISENFYNNLHSEIKTTVTKKEVKKEQITATPVWANI